MQDLVVSQVKTTRGLKQFDQGDLKNALVKFNGFLAAMRKNLGETTGSTVFVVDPAITECQTMGFCGGELGTKPHSSFSITGSFTIKSPLSTGVLINL